jgi:hypothetical protein
MKIQLLEKGEFIISTDDGKNFKGRFCMWSLQRFSELTGIENVLQLLLNFSQGMTVKQYAQFILSAVQYTYRNSERQVELKEDDVMEWMDEMQAPAGKYFLDLIKHGIGRYAPVKDKEKKEEKKSGRKK